MGVAGRYDPGTAAPYQVLIQEATERVVKKPSKVSKVKTLKKR
jgi:hypothetical protein